MHTNDSVDFALAIETGIAVGFFGREDYIGLDNAAVHTGAENDVLEEFLWNVPSPFDGQPMHITPIFLPPRAPELNPKELVWNQLVTGLRTANLHWPRPSSRVDIAKCYRHCRYFPPNTQFTL